jgi:chloramphenicol 3-O phosphotransferase
MHAARQFGDSHDAYSVPRRILPDCARRLSGLRVLFLGYAVPTTSAFHRLAAIGTEQP